MKKTLKKVTNKLKKLKEVFFPPKRVFPPITFVESEKTFFSDKRILGDTEKKATSPKKPGNNSVVKKPVKSSVKMISVTKKRKKLNKDATKHANKENTNRNDKI